MSLLKSIGKSFTFQTFGDSQKSPHLVRQFHGSLEQHADNLTELNKAGAGIFFTVNQTDGRGRGVDNVVGVRALFADFDTINFNRNFQFNLEPSYVIESSPGKHHCYWLLIDELPLNEFKSFQQALARMLGSDEKICDLPRVMRVPGFMHLKGEPFLVREIGGCGEWYSVDELRDWIKPEKAAPVESVAQGFIEHTEDDPDAVNELAGMCDTMRNAPEGTRNDTLNKMAFMAFGMWQAGRISQGDVYAALFDAATDAGLSGEEITPTLDSARRKAKPRANILDDMPTLEDDEEPYTVGKSEGLIRLIGADEIVDEPTAWLWDQWIARGGFHLLAGYPGTGKTTIAARWAATISTGGTWPDGTSCEQGNVLIFTAEDSIKRTINPRVRLAGADLRRVKYIHAELNTAGKTKYFDITKHLKELESALKEMGGFKLIIIDPIVSAIAGDQNKNEEVRRGLEPITHMAERLDCAIVGITHFGKNHNSADPMDKVLGSRAFTAVSRVVYGTMTLQNRNGDDVKILAKLKSNVGSDKGAYFYEIQKGESSPGIHSTCINWGEYIDKTSRDLVSEAEQTDDERHENHEAEDFLMHCLEDGPKDVKQVKKEASAQNINRRALDKARRTLKVKLDRSGGRGVCLWELPFEEIS